MEMNRDKQEKFDFLGLKFHGLSMDDSMERLEHFIQTKTPRMVFTPTAELIVRANEDHDLMEIYNRTDLLTLDSFVVFYAARLFRKPVSDPVSAARLMFNFLEVIYQKRYKMYLLGAREEVIKKTVENLKTQYPGINIVGWRNGYFDFENDEEVIEDIKTAGPDVLFVAMSSPLKEKFINKNLEKMRVPVAMGVGGSFDIIAGKCRLAPQWVSRMGIEWFYRFLQEPRRLWKRYLVTNTKFIMLVIKEIFKKRR